jgi:hypothetical protein
MPICHHLLPFLASWVRTSTCNSSSQLHFNSLQNNGDLFASVLCLSVHAPFACISPHFLTFQHHLRLVLPYI